MIKDNCDVCYKIICRGCGWEPNEVEVKLIEREVLTSCPDCGWKPGDYV